MKNEPKNEEFYVEISDANELRKELLLSSKQLIHSLKKQKEYQLLKSQKKELTKELVSTMNKIKELASSLQSHLPKTKITLKTKEKKEKTLSVEDKEDHFMKKLSKIEERLQALQ
ncbi:hypothetical protein HZA97_06360 [Candidatus Woesearchaeota archaeon]|nr:hypothetical protein [Candidatus Woesearchaeota archaeon]